MDWILNPHTNRMIKKNSITHRRLINQGKMEDYLDETVVHVIQPDDDIEEKKKELSKDLPPNKNIRVGLGRYKGKLVVGYKSGRKKKN